MNYYVLKLNNAYDLGTHYLSPNKYTTIPNLRTKELKDLSTIEDEFMAFDDTITEFDTSYIVKGSFPIIGIEKDNKIYDVITCKEIKYSSDPREINGLSYSEKYKADLRLTKLLLTSLTEEEIKTYISYLENLEDFSKKVFFIDKLESDYYLLTPNNIRIDTDKVLVKDINGTLVELITRNSFKEIDHKTKTSKLSYYDKYKISKSEAEERALYILDNNLNEYIASINLAKQNSIRKYNNYVNVNIAKELKKKTLHR